jgi:hypothetical protein
MGKYVNIGEEFVMDFIMRTKTGKRIDPGFGNKLGFRDIVGEKSAPPKPLVLRELLEKNYDKTFVTIRTDVYKWHRFGNKNKRIYKTMQIELGRIIIPRKIKSMYPNCVEVYYENSVSEECSRVYFFKVE